MEKMKDACKFRRKYRKYRISHTTSGMRNAIFILGLRGLRNNVKEKVPELNTYISLMKVKILLIIMLI